ncbi:MAG: glycosyltransferase [Saprospiraceae bacterium]|nr:glycosyltransferase [Saprospiraceae bacterium]
MDLIKAFELASIENKSLVMVGDGILKSNMEQYILDSKIDRVILPGFINQSEISKYYIASDVLVLCSESETWGLSINEAMNFRLPIILNENIGSF